MEAFASGVLVAGTRVGLLADAGDESITVDPGDAEGLAEKILQLIREPARVHAMRVRNRQTSEEWRAERTSAEFRKLYEGLMQKKQ
jgi:glycosyltransferase involved in cell wall biosynthesis